MTAVTRQAVLVGFESGQGSGGWREGEIDEGSRMASCRRVHDK